MTLTARHLQELFGAHGAVQSAEVIADRDTGRSKGFGFVEIGQRCGGPGGHRGAERQRNIPAGP